LSVLRFSRHRKVAVRARGSARRISPSPLVKRAARGLAGLGVYVVVVELLQPGSEELVELFQGFRL